MSVIGIVSMKGGVGKSTVCANLAAALAFRTGPGAVLAIDLDPQDALHLHLGLDDRKVPGLCGAAIRGTSLKKTLLSSSTDVDCLPYGARSDAEREAFEQILLEQPDWLAGQLQRMRLKKDRVVLIDTPPGPSVYLQQVFRCADIVIVVLLADAASYATVPAMQNWLRGMQSEHPHLQAYYLLNQLDRTDVLNRDVANLLYQKLDQRLTPVHIHADETVREALAMQQPVLQYEPHGQASHDIARLSQWLIQTLNA